MKPIVSLQASFFTLCVFRLLWFPLLASGSASQQRRSQRTACPKGTTAVQKLDYELVSNGCSKPEFLAIDGEEDFTYCCDRHDGTSIIMAAFVLPTVLPVGYLCVFNTPPLLFLCSLLSDMWNRKVSLRVRVSVVLGKTL